MKTSLQKRLSIFITLITLVISAFSTYLFTSAHYRGKEAEFDVRGSVLAYALSKSAEEGLIKEDLNLIKKASYIIKAPDVTLSQVYSNIWEPIDAYPLANLKAPPHPEAMDHFKTSSLPFHMEVRGGYDFYDPIFFRVSEDSPPATIGFVRITLSSASFRRELRNIAATNITAALVITLFAILSLNLLVRRVVVRPLTALHTSIARFKNGILPGEDAALSGETADEIRELALEFNRMCATVKENEARLVDSDRRIRSLFERVEHALFRVNRNGEITEANSRFKRLFGDVTGLCDILIGDVNASDCLRKAASEKALHIEDKALTIRGEELVISLSLYPERDAAGMIEGFDGYIIDITEKKQLEERLMRSQKLEAVGTLAAGLAHDFNNLLTAILGYAGILLKASREGDPFHKPASVIHEAAKRGAELGKKILTLTRKEKRVARQVNINELITQSLELLQRSLPRNIEIITKLHDALPLTNADPSQLQQVIINLAVNARDAMPDGGRLTVETSLISPVSSGDDLGPGDTPGFIKLAVSDTGVGIDADTQGKIFDPFFTTKDVGQGTGLGLYIVHSIITNHGGYINLYSEPQKGTRFNLYLPLAKGAFVEAQEEVRNIAGTETILIIDDEFHIRGLCKDMLTPLGYTVLISGSGSAGVELYREKQGEISLVILDMIMPKMSGTEVFHALKAINKDVKVLLYSGYSHNNFAGIDGLLRRGALGFVQKPFSLHDIGLAIRNAIEH